MLLELADLDLPPTVNKVEDDTDARVADPRLCSSGRTASQPGLSLVLAAYRITVWPLVFRGCVRDLLSAHARSHPLCGRGSEGCSA